MHLPLIAGAVDPQGESLIFSQALSDPWNSQCQQWPWHGRCILLVNNPSAETIRSKTGFSLQ
jgi:hypothetical protein